MALKAAFIALAGILARTGLAYGTFGYPAFLTETVWTGVTCTASPASTPVSTHIPFGATTMSGVTVHPASSPTSCYQLPTAVSALTPMALPLNQILETSDTMEPVFFYVGGNGTTPQYLGTFIGNSQSLLDLSDAASSAGRLAMTLPGGERLVVERGGIHLFGQGCDSVHSLSVESFWAQIVNITGTPSSSPPSQRLGKRAAQDETPFTVHVQVDKGTEAFQQAVVFGQSPCQIQGTTPGSQYDTMVYTCQYPGVNSGEKQCEAAFRAWLSNSPTDPNGVPGNLSDFLNIISPFLSQSNSAIASLLPRELQGTVSQALQWLGTTGQAVANEAIELGGLSLCTVLHAADENDLTFHNGSVATHTMGAFVRPPTGTLTLDLQNTPRAAPTREPPRVHQPNIGNFPMFTESAFTPINWPSLPVPGPSSRSTPASQPTLPPLTTTTSVPGLPPVGPPPAGEPLDTQSLASAIAALLVGSILVSCVPSS